MKWKCGFEQEFVIGGYTRGQGGRSMFGALVVGCYEGSHLRYASKVGTGFSNLQIRRMLELTRPFQVASSPFEGIPDADSKATKSLRYFA